MNGDSASLDIGDEEEEELAADNQCSSPDRSTDSSQNKLYNTAKGCQDSPRNDNDYQLPSFPAQTRVSAFTLLTTSSAW
jgi:hypothetical protein